MQDVEYDISVIVLCYNPDIKQLKRTLDSIVRQVDVNVEIIISDDGSKNGYDSIINSYFAEKKEFDYKYVTILRNTGTVKNVIRGVSACSSKYIKLISPGDYLVAEDTLSNWLTHVRISNASWSFGKAIYYHNESESNVIVIDRVKASPCILKTYRANDYKKCRYDYVINGDFCLGSATITRRDTMVKYLSLISNKVVFAEDTIYLLMMANREVCSFFDEPVVYYEHRAGVSNKSDDKWERVLREDFIAAYEILLKSIDLELSIKKELIKVHKNIKIDSWLKRNLRNVFIKGRIYYWIERLLFSDYSYMPIKDEKYFWC